MTRARRLLALLLAAGALASCGYTTRSLVPEASRTIAVPVFVNRTRRHDLEWEVTRAVVAELQARTHLRVVPQDDGPDLVLEGELVEVDEDALSKRSLQRPRESVVFVGADVTVHDRRGGGDLVAKRRVTERESYAPVAGESVRTAREEAVRTLAESIVRQLEEAW